MLNQIQIIPLVWEKPKRSLHEKSKKWEGRETMKEKKKKKAEITAV